MRPPAIPATLGGGPKGGGPKGGPNGGSANGAIVLLLSLFLLLLVFFIVLNANSVRESARVKAVMASLDRSFVVDPRLRETAFTVGSRSGTVFAAERLQGVGDLFQTAIAVAKVTTITPGQLMEVRLGADDLFEPGTATPRADRQGLIDRVAVALRQVRVGERVELDALLAISAEGVGQPPGPIERAAALARALISDGAPANAVSVGIERGAPGTARLLFTIRDAEDAAGDGRARAGRR